jgi:hypothetical protein
MEVVIVVEFYCSFPGFTNSGESLECSFMPIHVLNLVTIIILETL